MHPALRHYYYYSAGEALLSSYNDLVSHLPGTKYASNPVVEHDATYTNICPGGWIIDPLDSTKFLLYIGEFIGNSRTGARISLYTGNRSDPYTLTRVGVVLTATAATFDSNGVAFGSAINVDGTVYLYYGAQQETTLIESAGVATSIDGGRTFTKQGQALAPLATNPDRGITDPWVIYESGTYYMYVTRKVGTAANNALPTGGLIIATSSDGITFTRNGNVAVSLGTTTAPDAKYIEGGQVIKIGSDYCLLYTANSNSDRWSICLAQNTAPNTAFTKAAVNPVFEHGNTGWDSESVAVPILANISGNTWVMYYQGSAQTQPASVWDVGAVTLETNEVYPAGTLNNKNGWSGDIAVFDISGAVVIEGSRTLRGLTNTVTCSVSHTVDVVAGVGAYYKVKMRSTVSSGASGFLGGFYVMEGANIITGVYFNSGNLSYLRSSGWVTLQAYSANTTYLIEIFLPNKTQHTINVDGVVRATTQTNFTAITTKADSIKLEKNGSNTATVFYDEITCTDGVNTFTENFEV